MLAGLFTVVALVALSHGTGYALRHLDARRLARLSRGRLALTYDDGPNDNAIGARRLLQLLRQHGARATFFLVGVRAQRHPEMCQQLVEAGHEIASHGHAHLHAWRIAPWRAMQEVERSLRSLEKWLGPARLFRPPFGKLTLLSWWALRRAGAPLITWTLDSGDCWRQRPDPAAIVLQLLEAGGGVVLLHCHRDDEGRVQYVLDLTDRLLRAAREHGLEVCTCSELLGLGSGGPGSGRERDVA
jgi:peptidoglycan/xylan/chitin deacetylase (PgdA/CDA1 family)